MTRLDQRIQKCAVCGAEKKVIDIMSTSSFGPMDLDTRPLMMARSTLILEPLMAISHKILTSIF